MNKGADRLISFGIMLNQQNEAGHLSFVGHVNDFVKLLSNCKKLSEVSLDDWILDIYENNNMFKQGNDYPNKFKLLHGDVLCFRRLIVRPDRIRRQWFEDGIMHALFNLSKDEGDYLREHHIHAAPFYRIKRDRCCKCGEDYLQCSCVKFIDEDVADEVVEADLSGMTWTNRNAYFPKWSVGVYINPLVVGFPVLLLILLLTGSHNLLNYAIICQVDTEKRIITISRKHPQNTAFPSKKEQTIIMIKVLFICHGKKLLFQKNPVNMRGVEF